VCQKFQVSRHFAFRTAHASGDGLNLAMAGCVKGKDSIRLAQLGFLDDDSFRLVITRSGYIDLLLTNGLKILQTLYSCLQ
jgi:hypothetical protein